MTEAKISMIEATREWALPDLRELVASRDLLGFFILRDIKVRFRQTLLGTAWVVLQPLLTMATMSLVFGRMLGLSSDGVPYPLFCLTGLILWTYFTQAVSNASASIIGHTQLIEKVYFPRLIIPLAAALSGLLNLAISFGLLLVVMFVYGFLPGLTALLCLPLVAITTLLAIGVGSMFAALSVRFRDVNHIVPFIIQLWLFATPVIYASSVVPQQWKFYLALNPMTGITEMFRWSLLRTETNPIPLFAISCVGVSVFLPLGLTLFRRLERSFADVI